MTLWIVRVQNATPEFVITSDPAQVQAWHDSGVAIETYEVDATALSGSVDASP